MMFEKILVDDDLKEWATYYKDEIRRNDRNLINFNSYDLSDLDNYINDGILINVNNLLNSTLVYDYHNEGVTLLFIPIRCDFTPVDKVKNNIPIDFNNEIDIIASYINKDNESVLNIFPYYYKLLLMDNKLEGYTFSTAQTILDNDSNSDIIEFSNNVTDFIIPVIRKYFSM